MSALRKKLREQTSVSWNKDVLYAWHCFYDEGFFHTILAFTCNNVITCLYILFQCFHVVLNAATISSDEDYVYPMNVDEEQTFAQSLISSSLLQEKGTCIIHV